MLYRFLTYDTKTVESGFCARCLLSGHDALLVIDLLDLHEFDAAGRRVLINKVRRILVFRSIVQEISDFGLFPGDIISDSFPRKLVTL